MDKIAPTLLTVAALAFAAGCGSDAGTLSAPAASSPPPTATTGEPSGGATAPAGDTMFPDIEKAELTPAGAAYTLAVTVSSPYDSPDRYADGWRVTRAGTDDVLGEHTLGHDHASEQPFTREQSDLKVPDDVKQITIEGRDQENGFGGKTVTIDVP